MPVRNRHVSGDYLMVDDITGIVDYASNMSKRWDGLYMRTKDIGNEQHRHPQEFVRALGDPMPLQEVRPSTPSERAFLAAPIFVGNSTVRTQTDSPAFHLYDPGIGEMVVGISFLVR